MAHEIDELAPGVHAAVFARKDAWHKLGTTLDHEFTAMEALETAHLAGWNVRKLPLTAHEATDEYDRMFDVPDRWATVRTNPVTNATEYLGVVGGHYTPIQNEAHVDLLDTLVDESGAHFDTAGSLRKGREVFVSMRLPDHLDVAGADRIDLNLVALNSHDGSSAFRFLVSPVRVVCANTQAAAIAGARSSFSIRHTSSAGSRLQEAREALGLTFKFVEAFTDAAEKMVATDATNKWVDDFLAEVFRVDEKSTPREQRKLGEALELYRTSSTLDGIRGTRWGAYNTVTEYLDHFAPANGADKGTARAVRALTSHATNQTKERAFALAFA